MASISRSSSAVAGVASASHRSATSISGAAAFSRWLYGGYGGYGRPGGQRVAVAGREAVVTEGYVRGQVHASYLHTYWNGLPGAAARITAASREYRQARGPSPG